MFGILLGTGHLETLGDGGRHRGYSTAWLAHHLLGDQEAYRVFYGDDHARSAPIPSGKLSARTFPRTSCVALLQAESGALQQLRHGFAKRRLLRVREVVEVEAAATSEACLRVAERGGGLEARHTGKGHADTEFAAYL